MCPTGGEAVRIPTPIRSLERLQLIWEISCDFPAREVRKAPAVADPATALGRHRAGAGSGQRPDRVQRRPIRRDSAILPRRVPRGRRSWRDFVNREKRRNAASRRNE